MKHQTTIDRLRRACMTSLCASAAVLGAMGYLMDNWIPPMLLLPLGQAFILLWYFDSRLKIFAAEVGDALDDIRRDISEHRERPFG